MTVETLNQMMTYVIESWVLMSTAYLGVGFTTSFLSRVKQGLKAKEAAVAKISTTEEVTNAERVAEVTAVAEKYGKTADKQQVKSSVVIPGQ